MSPEHAFDPSAASDDARDAVWNAVLNGPRTVLVDSPPGAGKSTLVREISRRMTVIQRVPIIVQTNEQADDMVRGFAADEAAGREHVRVGRLHGSKYVAPPDLAAMSNVTISNDIGDHDNCDVVIAPAAKWALIDRTDSWGLGIVDEAYQMRSDALLPIGAMASRLLLVGDPGQLEPFTTADDTAFRGRPLAPTETAAATILTTRPDTQRVPLPVSWRLPSHTADVISDAFYRTPFTAGTTSDDRQLNLGVARLHGGRAAEAVRVAARTGWGYVELDDLILPHDAEAIAMLAHVVRELFTSDVTISDEHGSRALAPGDVAVGVTHRDQRDHVRNAVAAELAAIGLPASAVAVDTANVLQGREFQIVVVWHPLSGRRDASAFHLDAGRLCVLLSRHRQACIVVSRAGIREQLDAHPSTEPIWLGEAALPKDGWQAHLSIIEHLEQYRV